MSLLWALAKLLWVLPKLVWVLVKLLWTVAGLILGALLALIGQAGRLVGSRKAGKAAVRVRRDWNDHRIGTVRWSDLRNPRWDTISGGEQNRTPQPFIHAYVWCDMVKGDIAHSCAHGPGPHSIKVCLVKKDNSREVWNRLSNIVGARPGRRWWSRN